MYLSFSGVPGWFWLHLHDNEEILSSSLVSSFVSSSEMLVLLLDLLSSIADVTLVMTTWSELEPEDEFLVLVEEEIDENVVSLWVEMFLVLGFAGDEITLDALDERRDLKGLR